MHKCKCGKEFESGVKLGGHVPKCKIAKPENYKECVDCKRKIHVSVFKKHVDAHKGEKECLECGQNILNWDGIKKFCNRSCSAIYFNRPRKGTKLVLKECFNCGIVFKKGKGSTGKYCSNKCGGEHKRKQTLKKWQENPDGIKNAGRCIRNYLIEKFNHKCAKCGWHEVNPHTGNVPLEVEHIDGNSENNNEENLTILCPNCHSLTATYKGANKGNGRHARMKRYHEGKSY